MVAGCTPSSFASGINCPKLDTINDQVKIVTALPFWIRLNRIVLAAHAAGSRYPGHPRWGHVRSPGKRSLRQLRRMGARPAVHGSNGLPIPTRAWLGDPVRDASTTARFPEPGRYRVWVRARDSGCAMECARGRAVFNCWSTGSRWILFLARKEAGGTGRTVAPLKSAPRRPWPCHDLTGFEGRCDAILFCQDPRFLPPNQPAELASFRRRCRGLPDQPEAGFV